ncbi:MAG: hypothetical protein ACNYWM_03710 [Methanosarcinales archaeon]
MISLVFCESEIFNIAKKYGISSVEELEDQYKNGKIEEEDTWEDFFRLDHLEAKKESIKKALEVVRCVFIRNYHILLKLSSSTLLM